MTIRDMGAGVKHPNSNTRSHGKINKAWTSYLEAPRHGQSAVSFVQFRNSALGSMSIRLSRPLRKTNVVSQNLGSLNDELPNRPQAGNVIEEGHQWQCPCSLFMCGAAVDEKKDGKSSERQSSSGWWLNGRRVGRSTKAKLPT